MFQLALCPNGYRLGARSSSQSGHMVLAHCSKGPLFQRLRFELGLGLVGLGLVDLELVGLGLG